MQKTISENKTTFIIKK